MRRLAFIVVMLIFAFVSEPVFALTPQQKRKS